ncbi:MAG TPA: hypothetical protein VHT91_15130 [Kofleriaceae bacterium]|nr:hypothetical protein [Kofleriaceae bacterium]
MPAVYAAAPHPETGLIGAGKLAGPDVLLGIVDDPPRVWQHSATGDRSWPAPAQVGALAAGAQTTEIVIAAAWPEARVPRAEVWWLVHGAAQRHCTWQAPALERWKSQPRGASSVLPVSGGAIVAGVDGSLIQFDASCAPTVLHADSCCDDEAPLHLRAAANGWSAYDQRGARVYPAASPGAPGCVPMIEARDRRAALRAGSWTAPLPGELIDPRILDWSGACETVLLASGTHAWTCRATGCTRVR